MNDIVAPIAYVTWGSVRGCGPLRATEREAADDLAADQDGCSAQRGYSDRRIYAVDGEGYARDEGGGYVWPNGRTCAALSFDCAGGSDER